jgi:hypothetical protein
MAASHNRSTSSSLHPNPALYTQDESKASYDDLIDQYAAPYGANSNHQTYTLQSSPSQHRRGPSHPLKSPFSSKQSDDTSHEFQAVAYPPTTPSKELDTRPLWRKVCATSPVVIVFFLAQLCSAVPSRVNGMSALRSNGPYRNHHRSDR